MRPIAITIPRDFPDGRTQMARGIPTRANTKLARLKDRLEALSAGKWCLTGSGSAIYRIFGSRQLQAAKKIRKQVEEMTGCGCIIVRNNKW